MPKIQKSVNTMTGKVGKPPNTFQAKGIADPGKKTGSSTVGNPAKRKVSK